MHCELLRRARRDNLVGEDKEGTGLGFYVAKIDSLCGKQRGEKDDIEGFELSAMHVGLNYVWNRYGLLT